MASGAPERVETPPPRARRSLKTQQRVRLDGSVRSGASRVQVRPVALAGGGLSQSRQVRGASQVYAACQSSTDLAAF